MELKTLKDMQLWMATGVDRGLSVEVHKLKQEAIKWIKELESITETEDGYEKLEEMNIDTSDTYFKKMVISFIREFFNIIDEDLK